MYGGREALSAAEATQMHPTKGPPLLASPGYESIPLARLADANVTHGSRLQIRDAATTWGWPSRASGTRATAVHERPIVDGVRYGRHYPVRMSDETASAGTGLITGVQCSARAHEGGRHMAV